MNSTPDSTRRGGHSWSAEANESAVDRQIYYLPTICHSGAPRLRVGGPLLCAFRIEISARTIFVDSRARSGVEWIDKRDGYSGEENQVFAVLLIEWYLFIYLFIRGVADKNTCDKNTKKKKVQKHSGQLIQIRANLNLT